MSLVNIAMRDASPAYARFLDSNINSLSVGDLVLLYGKTDIAERNDTLDVQAYLPGWVAIGDNSGGSAFLMRLDGSDIVYSCGHGAIGSLEPELVCESFAEWLADECQTDDDD